MPNPGSYKEFTEVNHIAQDEMSIHLHSEALRAYRKELAEQQGVSIEELHRNPFVQTQTLGNIALGEQIG